MPNYCNYSMKVVGTKQNIQEFIKVIQADYNYYDMTFSYDRHMFRVFEAEHDEIEERADGRFETVINGYCAWSVASCMFAAGYYRDSQKSHPDNFKGTTLDIESKNLNLDIEVYSEEPGCCFQEHYIIINGDIVCDECVDWYEYWVEEYESKEDAQEELEIEITDEEWDTCDGCIRRGGFDDWCFEI